MKLCKTRARTYLFYCIIICPLPLKIIEHLSQSCVQTTSLAGLSGSVRWCLTGNQEEAGQPLQVRQHSFMEIDHEIFFGVILSHLLIQEGQLSVSGIRMCTSTG